MITYLKDYIPLVRKRLQEENPKVFKNLTDDMVKKVLMYFILNLCDAMISRYYITIKNFMAIRKTRSRLLLWYADYIPKEKRKSTKREN